MTKVSSLKAYEVYKTFIIQDLRPITPGSYTSSSAINPALTDVVGNCFTRKPQKGIIIGGYYIPEVGTESPEDLAIRY